MELIEQCKWQMKLFENGKHRWPLCGHDRIPKLQIWYPQNTGQAALCEGCLRGESSISLYSLLLLLSLEEAVLWTTSLRYNQTLKSQGLYRISFLHDWETEKQIKPLYAGDQLCFVLTFQITAYHFFFWRLRISPCVSISISAVLRKPQYSFYFCFSGSCWDCTFFSPSTLAQFWNYRLA